MNFTDAIDQVDWDTAQQHLDNHGYALLQSLMSVDQCQTLQELYDDSATHYRKTVEMSRFSYGQGEYKYFGYPLPEAVHAMRQCLYSHLAPIADHWMQKLAQPHRYPATLDAFLTHCHQRDQTLATPLLLTYGEGGFNTLHQDIYGEVWFPLQAAVFLNEPGEDFSGGEFVMSEQTTGHPSRLKVVNPQQGDVLIFATQFRPVANGNGYSRATVEHAVSEIRSGQRMTLGLIFHDASK